MKYKDKQGKILFVSAGLGGDVWGTFYSKNGKGKHRIKSKSLPMRHDPDQAASDLQKYAEKNKLEETCGE